MQVGRARDELHEQCVAVLLWEGMGVRRLQVHDVSPTARTCRISASLLLSALSGTTPRLDRSHGVVRMQESWRDQNCPALGSPGQRTPPIVSALRTPHRRS